MFKQQAATLHLSGPSVSRLSACLLFFFAAHLATDPAFAQRRMYKCVDAEGKTYYTQTPPSECLGRDTQVLNPRSGSVVKRIEGQLTPEQRAQREEEKQTKEGREGRAGSRGTPQECGFAEYL